MRLCALVVLLIVSGLIPAHAAVPAFTAPLGRDHPLAGKIWLPAEARFVTAESLVELVNHADAVLLGETHDNADHHALQAWMLARILDGGKRPLVAFEMIDTSQTATMAAHLARHPTDAAGLGPALDWQNSGWPDWALYRPIAQAALDGGAPLAAANLPRDAVRALARGEMPGSLDAVALALEQPLPPDHRRLMEEAIVDGHCRLLPAVALPGMLRVQRARDIVMANALAEGLASHGAGVLIAGAGHARKDVGVPAHLAVMAPGRRMLTVVFQEVSDSETEAAAYGVAADAVWFTPRAEREDACASLRQRKPD